MGLSLIIQSVIIFTISVSILPEKDNQNVPKKEKKKSIPSSCSWPAFTLTRFTQREHLSHIPLSGRCHYMLISSLKARKNLRLLRWPGLQTIRTSLPSSILWRWIMASESCSERVPAVAQKCSLPWSAALKWPDSLPADASSVREWLALLCKDFTQFSLISWSVWRKMSRHTGPFFFLPMPLFHKVFTACCALSVTF